MSAAAHEVVAPPGSLRSLANPGLLIPFVEAKVQATFPKNAPTKAIVVAFVDARAVASILDRTLGPEAWSFQLLQAPMMPGGEGWTAHGRLTVAGLGGREIHREDLGTGSGNAEMGGKGAASDALKRCAVQLGVGRALYALEAQTVPCDDRKRVAPEAMARCIEAWRAQLRRWAAKFEAGDAGADAPPAAAESGEAAQMPGDGAPSPAGGRGAATPAEAGAPRSPVKGSSAGAGTKTNESPAQGAPASGRGDSAPAIPSAPASSSPSKTAPPAPGNTPSPLSAEHPDHWLHTTWLVFGEFGLPWTRIYKDAAAAALKKAGLADKDQVKAADPARVREIVRERFAVKLRAEQKVPIPSLTDPQTLHEVTLRRAGDHTAAECTCESFKFNGLCDHLWQGWLHLALGMLASDTPIASEPWDGIDIEGEARRVQLAYEEVFPEAAAKRAARRATEAAADRAWEASAPEGGDG